MTTPKVSYDPETDAAYIRFSAGRVEESQQISDGIIFDYDQEGRIVGMEILKAREHLPSEVLEQAA